MSKKVVINDIFEEIDGRLIIQGVPIKLRYMEAVGEVSAYFGNVPIPLSPKSLLPNNEIGNQLCVWLHDWYDAKYGKLQSFNSDLGFFYQKIRGDLWHYRVPNFVGTCNFFIDKNLTVCGAHNETNIMRMSSNMTQAYVNSLTDAELSSLMASFSSALESFEILSGWRLAKIPFCQAIEADLKTISVQLQTNAMNYGQARWAYSQCAEKILKAWLLKAGISEKRLKDKYGHSIHKLVNAFNKHYNEQLSSDKFDAITCSPSARYDEDDFSSEDIIEAQNWLFETIKTIGFSPKLATI
ncbi:MULTISPECIES: HEPN domain-containing protein [Vibrio harveyi group]|uniref:HEPN domain-containing protein n=1 Tax=Vibrio harveyi group TaxID=717610 RepID=UPI00215CAB49|nr:HEPN domain-containing protein [Vibrio parahaemolyticus]MCR9878696.1 HEPN domain-containing protein [Vibrio parahaemolyticus]MCR9893057.1 HEPN domain-containing protein [Vibrio parahaemolyticus]